MASTEYVKILNAVLFNATWFGCVLGGELWGAAGLFFMGVQTVWDKSHMDLFLAVMLGTFGWVLDSAWVVIGIVDYDGITVAPVWIVILWCAVGLSVNKCMRWFHQHAVLGAVVASVAAPVSYLSAERLGATNVIDIYGLAAISLMWLVVFGCLFSLLRKIGSSHYGHAC